MTRSLHTVTILAALLFCGSAAWALATPGNSLPVTLADSTGGTATETPDGSGAKSKFRSAQDGWFDVSGFLDESYGFLPVVIPITEPAVGYGAAFALAFIDKPLAGAGAGLGRPNITAAGGLWTENDSWGAVAGDSRYWFDERLQTLGGAIYASVNLDFYGIGDDPVLDKNPLRYNLEPKGGLVRGKYRLGGTRLWAGLSYAFVSTQVSFDAPAETPGIPDYERDSDVGGMTPSLVYDSRDNVFTPIRGTYVEVTAGIFSQAFGGDDEFQRVQLVVFEYIPIHSSVHLGLRGDGTASFGDAPFYLRPFISLRGAAAMRYQGEQVAQVETELRWQFWKRLSLLGFVGYGAAWIDFDRIENIQTVVTGGPGFRYELAREYGIHAGVDVGFGPDDTAIYIQVGSAWARP